MSLAEARQEAKRRLLAEKTLGKVAPKRIAFEVAVSDFLSACEKRLRPGTVRLYRHHMTRHFPFGRQALTDIEPWQIVRALKDLPASQHEHAVRIGKTFFRWAIREHLIGTSPMARLLAPRGRPRSRVLSENELRAVWRHVRASQGIFERLVALLILTGQRRGEIARLEWSWLDGNTLTIPGSVTKNGREHCIPLGPLTFSILNAAPKLSERYVFPAQRQSRETTTTFNGWGKPKARLDAACGVTGWTLHDLRRTLASHWAAMGIPPVVTEKYLNHVSGGALSPIAQSRWLCPPAPFGGSEGRHGNEAGHQGARRAAQAR